MHMHILSVSWCKSVKPLQNPLIFGLATGYMVRARHIYTKIPLEDSGGRIWLMGTSMLTTVVLGCDGVYSHIRSIMWDCANRKIPGSITIQEKKSKPPPIYAYTHSCPPLPQPHTPMLRGLDHANDNDTSTGIKTNWKSLLGIAPMIPELGERDMTVVSNKNHSFLSLSQPDRVYFFFIFKLDEPFTWPKRARYTDEDAEALAQSVADQPVSESLLFGELWKKRIRGGLVSLEEGVLDHWYAGRIALAGDSVHKVGRFSLPFPLCGFNGKRKDITDTALQTKKVTPNIALGGNSGMESVVSLCNHLNRLVNAESRGQRPSEEALARVLHAYQEERRPRMQEICEVSGLITRVQAWTTPLHWLLGNWILPLQSDKAIADQLGEVVRTAPKLDYVSDAGFTSGKMAWKETIDKEEEKGSLRGQRPVMERDKARSLSVLYLPLLVSLLGVVAAAFLQRMNIVSSASLSRVF